MDLSKLRAITNNYSDIRLLSLRDWKDAGTIIPRDSGGPYIVMQEGYDPEDLRMNYDEFVLGRSGNWISVGMLLRLPREVRHNEYIFGTAGEIIHLLENLHGRAEVISTREEARAMVPEPAENPEVRDLRLAVQRAKGLTAGEGHL